MPDGRHSVDGREVIFKNVTRKYSGTYICEGSNGSGLIVNDTITVDVLRKSDLQFFKIHFCGTHMIWL